jgi:hypothetical protein
MPDEEWVRTLADGRKVKFTNQELLGHRAFITAQIAGNEVVYSVLLNEAQNPLGREEVESHLEGELSKKPPAPPPPKNPKVFILVEKGPMTSLLFTIEVSATHRDNRKIYSAQVLARNGEKLYHFVEALSISESLEQIVKQLKAQEKNSALRTESEPV